MTADSDAFQIVKTLPSLTPEDQQYLMSVSRGEGFYGLGWGNAREATIKLSEEFGIDPRAGVGSHNWGAIQGIGTAGSFPHIDHHADGSPYVGKYKKYNTRAEGAADLAKVLLKPNVKVSLSHGNLREAVFAQHANRYFELNPEQYLKAVKRNYDTLTANLGWPVLLSLSGKEIIANPPLVGSPSSESEPSFFGELSVLRRGSPNAQLVKFLQRSLNRRNYKLNVDGLYGPVTEQTVMHLQFAYGLKSDGIVGPLTWGKLNETT